MHLNNIRWGNGARLVVFVGVWQSVCLCHPVFCFTSTECHYKTGWPLSVGIDPGAGPKNSFQDGRIWKDFLLRPCLFHKNNLVQFHFTDGRHTVFITAMKWKPNLFLLQDFSSSELVNVLRMVQNTQSDGLIPNMCTPNWKNIHIGKIFQTWLCIWTFCRRNNNFFCKMFQGYATFKKKSKIKWQG